MKNGPGNISAHLMLVRRSYREEGGVTERREGLQTGRRGYRQEGGVTDRKEELQRGRSRRVEHVNTASHPSVSPLWKKVTLNEI